MPLVRDDEDDNFGNTSADDGSGLDDREDFEDEDSSTEDTSEEDNSQAANSGTDESSEGDPGQRKRTRADKKRERYENHQEIKALREQLDASNQQLHSALERIGTEMAQSTRSLADTARGMREPPKKSAEERMADELAQAAARVLPESQDGGVSAKTYFQEVARINAKYTREISEELATNKVREFERRQPRQPRPENAVYLSIANWLSDPFHNEGVEREIARLVRDERRNLNNPTIRDRTIRQAIATHAARYKLEVHMMTPQRTTQSPAIGGAGRTSFSGAGGAKQQLTPTPAIINMAAEHPLTKGIKNPKERVETFMKKILVPELQNDA